MSSDGLVFDMASASQGSPSVFVKKDWVSLIDSQNQSYIGNQCVLDTSAISNSQKMANYREAWLSVPLLLTLTGPDTFQPNTSATSADYTLGLKNWYGSIVHSITVNVGGTTVVQQTPLSGLYNTFRLMTTLSYNDIVVNGAQLGFYPDNISSFRSSTANDTNGSIGTSCNKNAGAFPVVDGAWNTFDAYNEGLLRRQQVWNFDPSGALGAGTTYATLLPTNKLTQLWKSYIFNKVDGAAGPPATAGVWQCAISAQIYLKHLHSFFDKLPLVKGLFMQITLNLNQSSVSFTSTAGVYSAVTVQSPLGGVSPLMLASAGANQGAASLGDGAYTASIAVGRSCLNTTQTTLGGIVGQSPLSGSVQLQVPLYVMSPYMETSYLSSPVKRVVYEDIYQYTINNILGGATYSNLISNGIANIKGCLALPYYTAAANGGISPIQSPFDTAGGGTTSPLALQSQFNFQISGQNAIYNQGIYSGQFFLSQVQGCNAVNGDMVDGLTSGLVDLKSFELGYCYHYVNVGRMLSVEESVAKSVNLIGQNMVEKAIDMVVFVIYEVSVSIDVFSGQRV